MAATRPAGGAPKGHGLDDTRDRARPADYRLPASALASHSELLPGAKLDDRILTNRALLHGRVQVSRDGSRLRKETRAKLTEKECEIATLVERMRPEWTQRLVGIDVHAFRKTHQTWAEAQGSQPSSSTSSSATRSAGGSQLDVFRAVRAMGASRVGRKHYLDLGSKLLDSTPSAEAVRGLIDEALFALTPATTVAERKSCARA